MCKGFPIYFARNYTKIPAQALRRDFCGPKRDYQGHYPIFFSTKCLSLLSGRTIDSLPTNRRQFTANIADKDHPDKGPHNITFPDGKILGISLSMCYYKEKHFFTLWTVDWDTPVIFAVLRTD